MKRNVIFLIGAIALFVHQARGQSQRAVDSLNGVLQTKVGADRYSPLYELTFEYLDKDNEKALGFIAEAEKAALLSGDSLWIVKSKRVRGQILYRLERTVECIPLFEAALAMADRNGFKREAEMICNPLALAYLFVGKFDVAIDKLNRTIQFSEQAKDTSYLILGLNNLGGVYHQLESPGKALPYLLRALDVCQQANRPPDVMACVNASLCYGLLNQPTKEDNFLNKAVKGCLNSCSENLKAHVELAEGVSFVRQGLYDSALVHFHRSLSSAKSTNDSRLVLENASAIAQIAIHRNNLEEAVGYLRQAEKLIEHGVPFPEATLAIYSKFASVYTKLNDYRSASNYRAKYIYLKDSIFDVKLTTRIMASEAEFKQRENASRVRAKNEIILLKDDIIRRQTTLNVVTAMLGFLAFFFLLYIFVGYRRKKKLNVLLEEKVRERTLELELSRDELLKNLLEMDLHGKRISAFVKDAINRIEGLCSIALQEGGARGVYIYLRRIGTALNALHSGINAFLAESTRRSARTEMEI